MATPKLARDRMPTLCALEVLKLIADHLEKHSSADAEDIDAVLLFLREVAHPCLDNTKNSLLVPFLENAAASSERGRVGVVLESHRRVCGLLEDLERSHRAGQFDQFVIACRSYTTVFGDLICEEDRFLPNLVVSSPTLQTALAKFDAEESALALRAKEASPALRRLETKYISPHCV
jgi:hypothetical protein